MRVAAYCRVSTDREDQTNSFESQQRYFREYIDRQPDWELYKIYADEGLSGTSTKKRVDFNRMINDARLGRFDRIITKEVSRFSRNILDTITYTRELRRLSVGVIFMNDGINTMDPDAELRLSIMGSIAQEESRKTSSRVKWGQTRRMEQGVVFGRSMLGYDVEDGRMTINPEGAEIVRQIFHKYVMERKGTTTIARELREAGYRTITGNVKWTNTVILKTLRNEKYVGDLCQKKTFTPDYLTHEKKYNHGEEEMVVLRNHHEPIIDRELWEEAQREISRRDVDSAVKEGHGHRFPFSGKIKCGECGSTFVTRYKKRRDGSKYKCWRCSTATFYGRKKVDAAGNEVGCDVGRQLRDEIAMEMVRKSVDGLLIDREAAIKNITDIVTEVVKESESGEVLNLPRLEQQKNELLEKKQSVLDAFFSQTITKEEMKMMNSKYDAQLAKLDDQISAIKKKQSLSYSPGDIKQDITEKVRNIVSGKTAADNFYGRLLNHLTVYDDDTVTVELNLLPTKWRYIIESLKNIQKRTQNAENSLAADFLMDGDSQSLNVRQSEHDVYPQTAAQRTRMDTGFSGVACHCDSDVPMSVNKAFSSS